MVREEIRKGIERYLKVKYAKKIEDAEEFEIFNAVSLTIMEEIIDQWNDTKELYGDGKQAFYMSAEYLMGRALGNNLISTGLYDDVKAVLEELNIDINKIEEIEEDAGLGNGGLGRLAACFMDSAATMEIPLTGYGIRYSNGLFSQYIEDGEQKETGDFWLKYGDPWSIRKDCDTVIVNFKDMKVKAVPYDTPIIGYGNKNINTLRLWKCEPVEDFNFTLFNDQKYDAALEDKNRAEDISRVLYPNDSNKEGKMLRLRQQYFFSSASLQDIVRSYKKKHGKVTEAIGDMVAVQLNDTHPTIAIPELIRILIKEEGFEFDEALSVANKVFAYTNHTILAEALEKWNGDLFKELFPEILDIIKEIDKRFVEELKDKGCTGAEIQEFRIINNNTVRMANLAIHVGHAVNGVAQLHTDILKDTELNNWYKLYPEKFQNKTNGITPRRWLRLCNKELSELITELLGNEDWVRDLSLLKNLEKYADDEKVLTRFMEIKHTKKEQLAKYIKDTEGVEIDPDSMFDIQIKRMHEYKRQLLNAFYILDLYFRIKENPEMDIPKTTFIFGAKAFPGYRRAKSIVKFINEIARLIDEDEEVSKKIKVHFVENYRVSYAEKLFPAADLSKQISTAGKEASGTGNMKFMLNGAPTFGTLDGANVEISELVGLDNCEIFGLKDEEVKNLKANNQYRAWDYYNNDLKIRRAIDSLTNGTFSSNPEEFKIIHDELMNKNDEYFLLADFESYANAQSHVVELYQDRAKWARICLVNIAKSGFFSSDRTIEQYVEDIWHLEKCKF